MSERHSTGLQMAISGLGKLGGIALLSRIIQLLAAAVVTRALQAEDFAIVAIVTAVQGTAIRFTSFNMGASLVRSPSVTNAQINVAWSYEALRGLGLAITCMLLAPVLSDLLHEPRLEGPLRVSSLVFLISGLTNQATVHLRRRLEFGKLGIIDATLPLMYAISVVVLVRIEPSYWALVWAGLIGTSSCMIVSYWMMPWRPAFNISWKIARPMAKFGIVGLLSGIVLAFREHAIVFFIKDGLGPIELGYFNRAFAFSVGLCVQMVVIVWRVAFPFFAGERNSGRSCRAYCLKAQGIIMGSGLLVVSIVSFYGTEIVSAVLGQQWLPMIPAWTVLCAAGFCLLACAPADAMMQAIHREVMALIVCFISTSVMLCLAWRWMATWGLVGVAYALLCGFFLHLVATTFLAVATERRIAIQPN